jgi:hypothetical protein
MLIKQVSSNGNVYDLYFGSTSIILDLIITSQCSALSPRIIHKKVNIVVSGTCALTVRYMLFVVLLSPFKQIVVKLLEKGSKLF